MDRAQIKTLQEAGYSVETVPTTEQPKMTFWRKEKTINEDGKIVTGENWVEMPNLPADPRSMQRYLARGFVPVKPEAVEEKESTCPQCGKVCKGEFGLHSHMKAHKNENKEETK